MSGEKEHTQTEFHLGALALLGLGHLVTDLTQGGLPVLLPFIREALGLSYAASGAILMTSNLTSSVVQPIFGYLSDRWGSTWLIPLGVVVATGGFSAVGFVSNYWVLLSVVFLSGLGVASYHPEGFKTARFFTGKRRATGLSLFSVGGNLGIALGPTLAIVGYEWLGLKGTILFLAPGVLVCGILARALGWLSLPQKELSRGGSPRERLSQIPIGSRWIPLFLLVCAVTVRSLIHMAIMAFVPFYLVDVLRSPASEAGKMVTVFLLSGALGTLLGAPIADRFGHKRYFVGTMAALSPVLWGFLRSEGTVALVLIAIAGGILVSSFSVTIVMAQRILPERLGIASGLMVGFAIGMGGIGATVMGSVADVWGVFTVLRIAAFLPLVGTGIALAIPYGSYAKEV
jgi:FSR family fosmidomycin resistance protein-like MFS transporter